MKQLKNPCRSCKYLYARVDDVMKGFFIYSQECRLFTRLVAVRAFSDQDDEKHKWKMISLRPFSNNSNFTVWSSLLWGN